MNSGQHMIIPFAAITHTDPLGATAKLRYVEFNDEGYLSESEDCK